VRELYGEYLPPRIGESGKHKLAPHQRTLVRACKRYRSFNYRLLVLRSTEEDQSTIIGFKNWIEFLRTHLNSSGRYRNVEITEYSDDKRALRLNVAVVPQLHEVYFGLGSRTMGSETGGIWIKDENFANAIFSNIEELATSGKTCDAEGA